jgi:CubicO group peptidase (beta-lactamase class C family)
MTGCPLGDLDPLINEAMAEWQVPGLAVAVVVEDEPVLVRAYGQRDVEAGLPATVDTQFALCSITKTFTAADWAKPVRAPAFNTPISASWSPAWSPSGSPASRGGISPATG